MLQGFFNNSSFDETYLCIDLINFISVSYLACCMCFPIIRTWSPIEEVNEKCKENLVEVIDISKMA